MEGAGGVVLSALSEESGRPATPPFRQPAPASARGGQVPFEAISLRPGQAHQRPRRERSSLGGGHQTSQTERSGGWRGGSASTFPSVLTHAPFT